MNKLNKILWGILSFGICAIYRTGTDAASYTNISDITNPVVGDTIDIDCDYGKLKLKIVYAFNNPYNGSNNNNDIPTDSNCLKQDSFICDTTTTYTNKCGANQTATPSHTSAVNPSDFSCNTLTCPDNGTLDKYAEVKRESLDLKKNLGCSRYYTGGSGHRLIGFSFVISDITANSAWYGSFTTSNSDNWDNQTYNIYWEQVKNNSINDCYKKNIKNFDSYGSFMYSDDTKCYYQ